MFFRRLSRSRSNSQSYVDNYSSPHDSKTNSANYDDKYNQSTAADAQDQRPPSSRQSNTAPRFNDAKDANMYPRQSQPQEVGNSYASPPVSAGGHQTGTANGYGHARYDSAAAQPSSKQEPAPDLLLQAFNQALRPYTDKVEALEGEIADLRAYIDQLESHRGEVHAWIDKRGLRPGE